MLLCFFSLLCALGDGGFGFSGFQINSHLFGPFENQRVRFAKYSFQFLPELGIVEVVAFRVVAYAFCTLRGVNHTARREWATLAPTIAVIVDPGDEVGIFGEFY